ncbi:MAG: peptidase M14 [Rhodothermales bacterium]|nr:peptidase M14 [Rhodothermales bacterium]
MNSVSQFYLVGALVAFAIFPATGFAQEFPFDLEIPHIGADSYDANISTPDDVIGHRIGNRHTIPSQVVDYFEQIASESDRVVVREHARSHEGRRLVHAVVTSPANHENLELIRAANIRLSEDPQSVPDSYFEDGKLVIYLGYSVHGNEASGTEAAVLTLFHLAAARGGDIDSMLDQMVIIVDPMLNPDGRDRFTDWVNRNRGQVHTTDSQDREHNEPWPGGRTNHYFFDLNRDWLPAVHPESQGRLEVFHSWRPQVHTDVHEMGGDATYFFQPGIPSRTHHLTPVENQTLTAEIATYHAKILEEIGSLYYTGESFDDFYYGKASAYPDANGAVGILFEQASSRALESETDRGTLHYAFTVRNQFLTSVSTLQASFEMRERLLRFQREYYASASDFSKEIGVDGYLIDVTHAYARSHHFVKLLKLHRINANTLTRNVTVDGHTFQQNDALFIPADQGQARLLRSIMETPTAFADSIFYDVSTWNLPFAFNISFKEFKGDKSRVAGDMVSDDWFARGEVIGASDYAYVIPWRGYYATKATAELMRAGFAPRIIKAEYSIVAAGETRQIPRGSILLPLQGSGLDAEEALRIINETVRDNNLIAYGVESGLTKQGPDLGTGTSASIPEPRVAIITGSGTSAYNAGETWHLLTVRMGLPVSLIDAQGLSSVDLGKYSVVIYAGGSTGSAVDPEPVKEWVRDGGTLITLSSGTDWAIAHEFAESSRHSLDVDSLVSAYSYGDLSLARGAKRLAGATLMTRVDTTHPVAYGLSESLPVFRTSSTFYDVLDVPGSTVAKYAAKPVLSGYVPDELDGTIEDKLAIATSRLGRGRVVMFADNPNFRGYWFGTNMALLNAIMLHRAI